MLLYVQISWVAEAYDAPEDAARLLETDMSVSRGNPVL